MLVDDERPSLDELNYILGQIKGVEVVAQFSDSIDALKNFKAIDPDVVFLDIEMPELDGLSLAAELIQQKPDLAIIFATAFDHYALKAFEHRAMDYVLKPFEEVRIQTAVGRLLERSGSREALEERFAQIETYRRRDFQVKRVSVWDHDRIILIPIEEIGYFVAEGGTVFLVKGDHRYEVHATMAQLEARFQSDGFFRCHRSYLANLMMVEELIPWFNNTYVIKITGSDEEIPVSRSHVKALKEHYQI
jgi:DNA-binding LytR/AlgR family response regulator